MQHLGAILKALSDGSQSMEAELAKHLEVHEFEWARKMRLKLKAFRTVEEVNGNVDRTAMEHDISKMNYRAESQEIGNLRENISKNYWFGNLLQSACDHRKSGRTLIYR